MIAGVPRPAVCGTGLPRSDGPVVLLEREECLGRCFQRLPDPFLRNVEQVDMPEGAVLDHDVRMELIRHIHVYAEDGQVAWPRVDIDLLDHDEVVGSTLVLLDSAHHDVAVVEAVDGHREEVEDSTTNVEFVIEDLLPLPDLLCMLLCLLSSLEHENNQCRDGKGCDERETEDQNDVHINLVSKY